MRGLRAEKLKINSAGTFSKMTETYFPAVKPSTASLCRSSRPSNSALLMSICFCRFAFWDSYLYKRLC